MDHTELAYLAGLFDGEGCIMILKRKEPKQYCRTHIRHQLRVQITNTNHPLMEWLGSLGWYVQERKVMKKGWKRCWVAVLHDNKAEQFLKDTYSLLRVKKAEAEIAFDLQDHKRKIGTNHGRNGLTEEEVIYRDQLRARLSELKNQQI